MDVIMPQLGETVVEGTVSKWYKRVGDTVRTDETLFDVETDKVNMEIPAPVAGVLTEIVVQEGLTAKVGARLAVISEAGQARAAAHSEGGRIPTPGAAAPAFAASVAVSAPGALEQHLSPVVRRLCAEYGIDPARIDGTGPRGRVTREDVQRAIEAKSASRLESEKSAGAPGAVERHEEPPVAPASLPDESIQPLNKIRRRTAAHMTQAWATVPHVFQAIEVNFSRLDKLRRERAAPWQAQEGFSLTYLPFIARAVCMALARFSSLNAVYEDESLRLRRRVNLGIAVDLGLEGLVVPVVKDAQSKSLVQTARSIHDLSQRARAGKLKPDDVTEGTYTISNSGTFGTVMTAPIVNVPQVAILSVDGIRKKPVVVESDDGDSIAICPVGMLAQCFDHRAVDGAYSASFLLELKTILETRTWREDLA